MQKDQPVTYEINVIGRHVEVTDAMKRYAEEKVRRVERYAKGGLPIYELTVTLDIQKLAQRCHILVKIGNTRVTVHAIEETMYAAIDVAVDKLLRKIHHYHSRIVDHHKKGHAQALHDVDLEVNVVKPGEAFIDNINDEIDEENRRQVEEALKPHEIVSKKTLTMSTLTPEEAIMKMELSEDNFLIFRNEIDHELNVIYRRDDGNYGIISAKTA